MKSFKKINRAALVVIATIPSALSFADASEAIVAEAEQLRRSIRTVKDIEVNHLRKRDEVLQLGEKASTQQIISFVIARSFSVQVGRTYKLGEVNHLAASRLISSGFLKRLSPDARIIIARGLYEEISEIELDQIRLSCKSDFDKSSFDDCIFIRRSKFFEPLDRYISQFFDRFEEDNFRLLSYTGARDALGTILKSKILFSKNEQAFLDLEKRVLKNYGKVKTAIRKIFPNINIEGELTFKK